MHTHNYKMGSNGHTVFDLFFSLLINMLHWFNAWVILIKIPWRRKWQPTPAFLPGEAHVQRSLEGHRARSRRVRHELVTEQNSI